MPGGEGDTGALRLEGWGVRGGGRAERGVERQGDRQVEDRVGRKYRETDRQAYRQTVRQTYRTWCHMFHRQQNIQRSEIFWFPSSLHYIHDRYC